MSELSQEEYQNLNENFENNNNDNEKNNKNKSNHYSRFLLQLYSILEEDKYKDIIHWGDNGKYFVIENVHDFTEKILPKYYNHNNYSSFVRQLNMYDFHKKKTNSDGHTFQHSKFIKGQKELIKTIFRKRKKYKNQIITSLIPLNTELINYNDNYNFKNNYKNTIEKKDNLSIDKHSLSLSLDEEKDNNQFNIDNIEHSLIEYNKKNYFPKGINEQLAALQLKKNLMGKTNNNINNINLNFNINNNINNGNKKITKKNINDLLNCLINNIEENTRSQKQLNTKIDSLSNQNLEYIKKNNSILDEIKSKIDYNKKFESVVCFILGIQKIKNEGSLKNILISNEINNNKNYNHLQDNQNDLNNLEIINLAEPKKEINNIIPSNEFLQKKTYNNGIIEPFQSFLNKYIEKNKKRGLLANEETINNMNLNKKNNNKEIKNRDNNINNNLLLSNGNNTFEKNKDKDKEKDKEKKAEDLKIINNSILKDNCLDDCKIRSPSIDFTSSIFNRKRSSSFNSLVSNNTNNFNDNFINNDFIFKKFPDSNSKNDTQIFVNNNQNNENYNLSNNFNKSFDGDFIQNSNNERKDSLNNSSISYFDLANKSDKLGDIFGGDNNSINFS